METTLKIKGNWNELKTELKKQYPKLTDDDLRFTSGKEDELLSRLEKKLRKTKDEICDTIDELQSESSETVSSEIERSETERNQPGRNKKEDTKKRK